MARFILELRVADISDPSPVVQDWILDTDKSDSTADFIVPAGVGANEELVRQINRAVVTYTPRDLDDDLPLSPTDALLARAGMRLRDRKERE